MNNIILILAILFGAAVLAFIVNRNVRRFSGTIAFLAVLAVSVLFFTSIQTGDAFTFIIGGVRMQFGLEAYSYIFALIVLGLSSLALLYSIDFMKGKDRLGYFYSSFLMSILGMMGIIFAEDFISFFIFWEIMTWSSYLIVIYNGQTSRNVGLKYMIFSAIGAYAMLTAIVSIKGTYGTFLIGEAIDKGVFQFNDHIYIPILLLIGFAVKTALMPLHVWAPDSNSKAPMSFTAVFSGALSKMGVLGMGLVLTAVYTKANPDISLNALLLKQILGWLGAITAVMATVYALIQTDAKKLLAYSSVAQLGYIVVGLSTGTKLGVMAALFLAVVHAMFKGVLFMVAGAVERQAGTTDMTKISGLIRKMPWTFFSALIAIIALAGVPPLGGFVGKWMLYEALITESNGYFLIIVVFFSSTAAFLYSYRFLFGLFLGQEEKEIAQIKEAPIGMIIPMLLLSLLLIVTGLYPGILFDPIAKGMHVLGFENVTWNMSVLTNIWGDQTNMNYIFTSIGIVFVATTAFLTFKGAKGTRNVGTKEISTSGEIPQENKNLTFQLDFFKPFERAAAPLYKRSMNKIWNDIGNALEALFTFTRRVYTGNGQTYAFYVVIFLVILFFLKDTLFNQ